MTSNVSEYYSLTFFIAGVNGEKSLYYTLQKYDHSLFDIYFMKNDKIAKYRHNGILH